MYATTIRGFVLCYKYSWDYFLPTGIISYANLKINIPIRGKTVIICITYREISQKLLEGIMYEEWYNPLFKVANELYGANVYSYYFDIPFEETVRRHQTRSKSQEFGEEHMRGWWREKDFSAVLKEQLITCEMDANSIVAKVYADLLKEE